MLRTDEIYCRVYDIGHILNTVCRQCIVEFFFSTHLRLSVYTQCVGTSAVLQIIIHYSNKKCQVILGCNGSVQ